jgi:quinol monooxygenase YgiN
MKIFILFTALFIAADSNNLSAQTTSDEVELQEFLHQFMAAYNQSDVAAIQKMYVEDATRTDQYGKKIMGADQIAAFFREQFILNNATLLLQQKTINWSDYHHAFIVKGTFEIYGITNVYDIMVNISGAYENTMLKFNGKWKIAKSVLTPTVKVFVSHQVNDFDQWKLRFEAELSNRLVAGELSSEFGTIQDDPKTVYIISKWTSVAAFQDFFTDSELQKSMEEAGVIGKPTVLILNRQ